MTQTTAQTPPSVDSINHVLLRNPAEAVRLFRQAADAGDAEAALQLAVLAGLGLGRSQDFALALDHLAQAASLGSRSAQRQLSVLAGIADPGALGDWKRIRQGINLTALLEPPTAKVAFEAPRIEIYEGLATRAMCDFLVAEGRDRLEGAKVLNIGTGELKENAVRTATSTFFDPHRSNLVIAVLQEKVKRLTGLDIAHHEPPNLLSYEPGQEYKAHFDFIPLGVPALQPQLDLLGQRIGTCLTYLNDDYEGGETSFLKLNWKYRGRPGDALLFHNTRGGEPDGMTLHAGLPPAKGRKFLLSKWLRAKPLPIFRS